MTIDEAKKYIYDLPFNFDCYAHSGDNSTFYFSDPDREVGLVLSKDNNGKFINATLTTFIGLYEAKLDISIPHPRIVNMVKELEIIKDRGEAGVQRFRLKNASN